MGYNILTSHQSAVLEQAATEPNLTDRYFFTGRTALAEFYLGHRKSEDLDFFTSSEVNKSHLDSFLERNYKLLEIEFINPRVHHEMIFYLLNFTDKTQLKVDFVQMDYPQIEQRTQYKLLQIDSVFDIALNKFYAIWDRTKSRDFIDLYFILTTQGISLEQVLRRMPDKFPPFSYNDALERLSRFTSTADFQDYPTMLVPFDKEAMVQFYLKEAKKLEKDIFR